MNRYLCFVVLLIGISLILLVCYWQIQLDDSYIYYSYARNLAHGEGYVFNQGGARVNATTSTLYTILVALVAIGCKSFSWINEPMIGHIIGVICLFITAVLLMRCFMTENSRFFPAILPVVFLFNPLLMNSVGMEIPLALMLVISTFYFFQIGRPGASAISGSLAVLARPDMVLAVIVLVMYDFVRNRRMPELRSVVLFLLPIVAWLIFNFLYFGNPIPTTISAKIGQTESGWWGTGPIFLKGFWNMSTWHGKIPRNVSILAAIFGLCVFTLKFRRWSVARHPASHLILVWNMVHLAVYGFILNPPPYIWYYSPLSTGLALLTAMGIDHVVRTFPFIRNLDTGIVLRVTCLFLVAVGLIMPIKIATGNVSEKYEIYKKAANWFNTNAEAGSSVGAVEIGVLRYYYQQGPIIDGLGLVTPDVKDHVRKQDSSWYVRRFRPDYLMSSHPHWPGMESVVETTWFNDNYRLRNIVTTEIRAVAIYQRIESEGILGES